MSLGGILGGGTGCPMMKGGDNHLSPAELTQSGGLRRRLRRTKGHARRARVRSSSAGGKKRGGSRKSKKGKKHGGSRKSKKHGGSRKHKHSKRCHH